MLGVSSSAGPSYQKPIEVNYNDEDASYKLNSEPATESEVNAALKANGITATGGLFKSPDGFEITASSNGAATNFGGPTPLPDVAGGTYVGDMGGLSGKAEWMSQIADGALMWSAMSEMARGSIRDMTDARQLKNAMNKQKLEAKEAQINATQAQIEAERKAAAEALTTAVVTAVITAVISIVGAGSAWGQIAGAVGGVLSKAGDLISKTAGGQRTADEKKVETKRWEREEAIMDDAIDSAKSSYEEAKEQFKLAMRILVEHMERQSQVVQKITS